MTYVNEVLKDNPSHYWRLDTADATIRDVIGGKVLAKQGTLTTRTGPLPYGAAMNFDNNENNYYLSATTNDYVQWPASTVMTIEFWMQQDVVPAADCIVSCRTDSASADRNFSVFLNLNGDGKLNFDCGGTRWTTIWVPTAGVWHHVVLVYDTGPTRRIYVDSALIETVSMGRSPSAPPAAPLSIGRLNGSTYAMGGGIDELAIYFGTALSDTRIADHYNARLTDHPDGWVKMGTGRSVPAKVWNGSAWVEKPVKRHNGTSWVLT